MTEPGIRARRREHLEAEILRLGRAQLAEVGAPGLSVRRVARDLGMASSAVYRYVASRDELLTRLIVESYGSLGDTVEAAESMVDRTDLRGRWRAVGGAVRTWALARPHDWALLYGSPVPGYAAPAEQTVGPGTRVQVLLVGLLRDAVLARRAAPPSRLPTAGAGALQLAAAVLADLGLTSEELPAELVAAGLTAWTLMTGAVSSEVFGYVGPDVPDPEAVYAYALDAAGALVLR